ncbi:MAG: pentapeptide repeat-containing protein [Anaerolineaceae bacterium]|nr:MAG: pentapeptide repeat-containing protein [Anaerolineaceae bacterium]
MADARQLEILKKSVFAWNEWRGENPKVPIDLSSTDLRSYHFWGAHLAFADLRNTDLRTVNFRETNLEGAKLGGAMIGGAVFVDTDLSKTEGLEEVAHISASHISTSTIHLSKGKIPAKFLRGCGLRDWEIESAKLYQPGLSTQEIDNILYRVHDLRAGQAVQFNNLFISYNHKDSAFVDAMEKHLDKQGIRFWRDIHDATSGRLEKVVDRAMRQNPTVLLVLSKDSVQSDWVEHEARSARELEKELKRDVLCDWPARLREQIMEYNILDFSNWKDESEFTRKFAKLVEGLDLFYKE